MYPWILTQSFKTIIFSSNCVYNSWTDMSCIHIKREWKFSMYISYEMDRICDILRSAKMTL